MVIAELENADGKLGSFIICSRKLWKDYLLT